MLYSSPEEVQHHTYWEPRRVHTLIFVLYAAQYIQQLIIFTSPTGASCNWALVAVTDEPDGRMKAGVVTIPSLSVVCFVIYGLAFVMELSQLLLEGARISRPNWTESIDNIQFVLHQTALCICYMLMLAIVTRLAGFADRNALVLVMVMVVLQFGIDTSVRYYFMTSNAYANAFDMHDGLIVLWWFAFAFLWSRIFALFIMDKSSMPEIAQVMVGAAFIGHAWVGSTLTAVFKFTWGFSTNRIVTSMLNVIAISVFTWTAHSGGCEPWQ